MMPLNDIRKLIFYIFSPTSLKNYLQNRFGPDSLWRSYVNKCSTAKRTAFLLSFDCDTELDIKVISSVIDQLDGIGVKPVLAVPGQLIQSGLEIYRSLADRGVEFINHGFVQHTHVKLPERIYESSFFYDKLSRKKIIEDITKGDETLTEFLGIVPKGFRTPHFGSFQKKSDLKFLWKLLRDMGYEYSSSTTPIFGIRNGPMVIREVVEFPMTGCPSWPIKVLDSWGFRFAPNRDVREQDFINQIQLMVDSIGKGNKLIINIYADPSQVYDWPEFFEAIAKLAPYAVESYMELFESISQS